MSVYGHVRDGQAHPPYRISPARSGFDPAYEFTCPWNWAHSLHDCHALGRTGELIRSCVLACRGPRGRAPPHPRHRRPAGARPGRQKGILPERGPAVHARAQDTPPEPVQPEQRPRVERGVQGRPDGIRGTREDGPSMTGLTTACHNFQAVRGHREPHAGRGGQHRDRAGVRRGIPIKGGLDHVHAELRALPRRLRNRPVAAALRSC